jgi:hypothetical protein
MAGARTPWEFFERRFQTARNHVRVLPPDAERREVVVHDLGLDPDGTIADITRNIGGAFVDHGWFRLLGSGHPRMTLGLDAWNGARGHLDPWRTGEVFVVAHDVVGGFFVIDLGALGFGRGRVAYLAPDTLQWEDLEMDYSGFVQWLADGDVAAFAGDQRWPGWQNEVAALSGDQGIFVAPPLWAEGPPFWERSRTDVPMTGLWTYAYTTMRHLEGVPDGSPVKIGVPGPPAPGEEGPTPGW